MHKSLTSKQHHQNIILEDRDPSNLITLSYRILLYEEKKSTKTNNMIMKLPFDSKSNHDVLHYN